MRNLIACIDRRHSQRLWSGCTPARWKRGLVEVGGEFRADVFRQHGHMAVARMREAQHHLGAGRAKRRDLGGRKIKMDELDGGGLAVFAGAILIGLCASEDAVVANREDGFKP